MLCVIVGVKEEVEVVLEDLEGKICNEVVSNIVKGLMKMVVGGNFDELGVDVFVFSFDVVFVINGSVVVEIEIVVVIVIG